MQTFDVVNLAITVGLGILSLGLGGFSIWLSLKFNDRSNEALDSVKELSNDLKSLMEVSLTHQKDFSSKMLDSILEQNQYGVPLDFAKQDRTPDVIEEILNNKLSETESHLAEIVEEKIKGLSTDASANNTEAIEKAIDDINSEISKIRETALNVSHSFKISGMLKENLKGWKEFPAHYVVLACIVKESISSYTELEKFEETYNFPEGYEAAVDNLINTDILKGSLHRFSIHPEDVTPLSVWVERNWPILEKFIAHYATKNDVVVTEYETNLADELVF